MSAALGIIPKKQFFYCFPYFPDDRDTFWIIQTLNKPSRYFLDHTDTLKLKHTCTFRRHSGTLWITILQHDKTSTFTLKNKTTGSQVWKYVCLFCKILNFGSEAEIQRCKILSSVEQDLANGHLGRNIQK